MKFIIKSDKGKEEIELYLKQDEDEEEITLKCTDKNGETWNVMEFENGKFRRILGIPNNIGIEVNEDGKIKEQ